ncbi:MULTISPECIES: YybH family protein [Gluconobacter]|uniref:SgcJ/EcaC family oxidoreductase n=1 Tax=Gluconobacter cadivus TaxID=2728101 RepID=A0ABR9YWA7_9PROT|nr:MULTISPECIES: SgcJ/EcaC family oxidoreductase [Gluconobacter]MBF0888822.1 SgcJ/EcaC family oxidoreductase [Gluconobacter cadivus]MBS1059824.1 SgcJ/EcaC family oxidoreductase [Gluconobacter sp. Dm-44]
MAAVHSFEIQGRSLQRLFITGTFVMIFTKPFASFLGASMALVLQCAPAMAASTQSPDVAAVKAVTEQFAADLAKGDLQAISRLYTDDARLLPPNADPISGRAAILAYFEKTLRPDLVGGATFDHYEIYGGENAATSLSQIRMLDTKGQVIERGKQTIVLLKQDGKWKIHRDMWSDNSPTHAAEP